MPQTERHGARTFHRSVYGSPADPSRSPIRIIGTHPDGSTAYSRPIERVPAMRAIVKTGPDGMPYIAGHKRNGYGAAKRSGRSSRGMRRGYR